MDGEADILAEYMASLTDGALINRHGELLYIVIEEDWTNERRIRLLERYGQELRRRNSQ